MNEQTAVEPQAHVPAWIAVLRAAAQAQVKQSDIEEIVQNQLAAAKEGNKDAIKFVFEMVLGGGVKAGTLIQNNYYDGKRPDAPTTALPGTGAKVEEMRRRVAAGKSPLNPADSRRE